jgi:acetolactate synthase-1/2/3 large subunit
MTQRRAGDDDLNADEHRAPPGCAFLEARGVDRVFGLQGGHIQPIWDHVARGHPHHRRRATRARRCTWRTRTPSSPAARRRDGHRGPGVTNTVTAIANASLARAPVLLIGGCTSRPQANMGPLQDIPHVDILRPVTRLARTARVAEQVIRELDEAVARAMGDLGEPGPVYLEIPTDVLRTHVPPQLVLDDWLAPKPPRACRRSRSGRGGGRRAWSARRPLVVTGRGARERGAALVRSSTPAAPLYLDTRRAAAWCRPSIPRRSARCAARR